MIPAVEELEKKLIRQALKETSGNVVHAAAALEIPIRTLYNKLERYDLWPDDFRPAKKRWSERTSKRSRKKK